MNYSRRRIDPLWTTLVLLWVMAGSTLVPGMLRACMLGDAAVQHQRQVCGTINPNTAAWWELSLLPEIGESTARQIVQYRLDATHKDDLVVDDPVFGEANDLEKIRGIGPKTVAKIATYLHFED